MSAQLLVCAFAREHPLATASGRIASPLRNAAPSAVSTAWVALGKLPFAANAGICAEVIACDFHQRLRLADFIPAAAQLRLALARPPLHGFKRCGFPAARDEQVLPSALAEVRNRRHRRADFARIFGLA